MPYYKIKTIDELGRDRYVKKSFSNENLLQQYYTDQFLISYTEIKSRKEKISKENLLSFTGQLESLVSSGLVIDEAIRSIVQSEKQEIIKSFAQEILENLKTGLSLSNSIKNSDKDVPSFYISAISGGEESNNLNKSLNFLYSYIKDNKENKKKIVAALTYPIMVFIIAIIAVTYLLIEVVPGISRSYTSINQTLPDITLSIIFISNLLIDYGLIFIASVVSVLVIIYITINDRMVSWFLRAVEKIPYIGKALKIGDNYNLLITTGMLINQGISIDIALKIARNGLFLKHNISKVDFAISNIRTGGEISKNLFDAGIVNKSVVGILKSGEVGNKIGERMIDVAKITKDEQDRVLYIITSVLGPISIVLVGGMVLFIALGMLMPMFNLSDMEF